jgi:hypothetical protein
MTLKKINMNGTLKKKEHFQGLEIIKSLMTRQQGQEMTKRMGN